MRLNYFLLSMILLAACGNAVEGNHQSVEKSNGREVGQVTSRTSGKIGKVTELEPEKNIVYKKIIFADPYEFKERMDAGSKVIDVRPADEYTKGHIPGAVNIQLDNPDLVRLAMELKNNLPILVYGREGEKNNAVAKSLEKSDFDKIYVLDGGYAAWVKAGFAN